MSKLRSAARNDDGGCRYRGYRRRCGGEAGRCTTNPTIVLKALGSSNLAGALDEAVVWEPAARPAARRRSRRSPTGSRSRSVRRSARSCRVGLDRGRCRPVPSIRLARSTGLAYIADYAGAASGVSASRRARLDLGRASARRSSCEGGNRPQPTLLFNRADDRLRRGGRVPDLALRWAHHRLVQEGGQRGLHA